MIFEWTYELRFLVALALGFLIGLERESTKPEHERLYLGGVRTFPIVSMLGFGCAWLYEKGAAFVLPVGLLVIGGLAVVAYIAKINVGRTGSTSEIALILIFVVGALTLLVDVWIAMAISIVATLLLSEKTQLETYVERLDRVGFLATIKFLLVTVIILPILPNEGYTQFKLNPARIWQIVALVSGIGYVGYLLSKRFGKSAGLWMSGLLGGMVSSTATSISMGRLAQQNLARSAGAMHASVLASSVMYLRVVIIVSFFNPAFVYDHWWRFVLLALIGAGLAATIRRPAAGRESADVTGIQNPFELKPALVFAGLFVLLSIVTRAAVSSLGADATKLVGLLAGIADVDAFTLSVVRNAEIGSDIAVSAVLLAAMTNTVAKGVYFGVLAPATRKDVAWRYALWAVLHLPLVFV